MGRAHYIGQPELTDSEADQEPVDDAEATVETEAHTVSFTVGAEHGGWRLDRVVAALMPSVSRSRLQAWIERGAAQLNGNAARSRDLVHEGDRVQIDPQPAPERAAHAPEAMALDLVYEDEALIVLDKPPGLVVHPGAGNWSGTLLNGLLARDAALAAVPRAGIVHRLDAGTSGLMVIARTAAAQLDLVRQLQARQVVREYWAIVTGVAPVAATIDAALSRDPRNPLRFRVSTHVEARAARTHLRRLGLRERSVSPVGAAVSWLACRLETGRTHQIRVHLESIGHPLLGDPLYTRRRPALVGPALDLKRQALHACRLSLIHPGHGRTMAWFRPPPPDMHSLMTRLGFEPDRPLDPFGERVPR